MNMYLIFGAVVILIALFLATRSDKSKQVAAPKAAGTADTSKKPVEKLSKHDAAVWLDDFLVKQQKDQSDDTKSD
jgi:hypothetical protein